MKRPAGSRGFTLVELLVVIGIIGLLATFLIGALMPQKKKAQRQKSSALLKAIQGALDQYYAEFHDYPPDGYDNEGTPVTAQAATTGQAGGTKGYNPGGGLCYAGTGCLIYFLCYPITNSYSIGADTGTNDPRNQRTSTVGPYLSVLKDDDVTVKLYDPTFSLALRPGAPGYQASWCVGEIIDAFGYPMHYDKVKENPATSPSPINSQFFNPTRFVGQAGVQAHTDQQYYQSYVQGRSQLKEDDGCAAQGDGASHILGTGMPLHSDPRSPVEPDGCFKDIPAAGPRNANAYDVWAHGEYFGNARSYMSNWTQQ